MHSVAKLPRIAPTRTGRSLRRLYARTRVVAALCLLLPGLGTAASAQSLDELISNGDRESLARRPALALPYFEKALALEPEHYEALCKASRELVDLGEFETNTAKRTDQYARAVEYARRAIRVKPDDAEGHFHMARAIGRTALALGPRDRTRYGIEVREQAMRALELAPRHPGALHVMGVWNAEVMRLNGLSRLVAKTFLGGQIFGSASWPEAIRYMEAAVAEEPTRLVHLLDLARVYRDAGRKPDALATYTRAINAPAYDANDEQYRAAAIAERRKIQ